MDGDIGQTDRPAQALVRPQRHHLGDQNACDGHQAHEIAATIEGTTPTHQQQKCSHKQDQGQTQAGTLDDQYHRGQTPYPQLHTVRRWLKHGIEKAPNPNRLGGDIHSLNWPRPNPLRIAALGDAQIFGHLYEQTDAAQDL